MDVAKRMADLVNVTTRLIDVLERENEILRPSMINRWAPGPQMVAANDPA